MPFSECCVRRRTVSWWEVQTDPELAPEMAVVEKAGRRSAGARENYSLFEVSVDGKLYSALSMALLRGKLGRNCGLALVAPRDAAKGIRGDGVVVIKDNNGLDWVFAIRCGDYIDTNGNKVHVEDGKISQSLAMKA